MSAASPRHFVLVIALAAFLYLLGNGAVSLWDRDEPRYAQTSRQMLQSGDWVVPRFLDKVRTAKPVFIYWCQAAAMAFIGDQGDAGVFAARLPSVVAMTIVLTGLAVVLPRAVGRERTFWTIFILASSVLAIWSAKTCLTDAVLLVGITTTQLCLYAIWRGRASWPVVILLAVAVAQAGLTKGPVVLGVMGMTLVALGVFRLLDVRRDRTNVVLPLPSGEGWGEGAPAVNMRELPQMPPSPQPSPEGRGGKSLIAKLLVGAVIVVALVAPWIYLVQQRESKFLDDSVSHDVLRRIAQPLEGHKGPPGYHLALIFATFFPWSLLLPMAIAFAWKNRADPQIRFALAAVLGPWVMFEIVRTKLPHYMLPTFPPLAFLTADAIVRCLRGEKDDLRRTRFVVAAALAGGVMVAIGIAAVIFARRFGESALPAALVAGAAAVFAGGMIWFFQRRKITEGLLATGVGMGLIYAVLFGAYLPRANFLRLSTRVADVLHREVATGPGESVMLDYKEPSLAFYQGGTIRENPAMSLTHDLLDRAPKWLVVTDEVLAKSREDVRNRVDVVATSRGLAYADGGRTVNVVVVKQRFNSSTSPAPAPRAPANPTRP